MRAAFLFALPLMAAESGLLWQDPGHVEKLDFRYGKGGAANRPRPPFEFVSEDTRGNSPKVIVRDAQGTEWRVKGGHEAKAENFVSRLVWACGYFAETLHYLREGRIENVSNLKRASGFIKSDGAFTAAGFEKRDPALTFKSDERWTWISEPVAGTKELNGLKILVMLVSNWDNKDARDIDQGSNTSVAEVENKGERRLVYFVNDWGKSLGTWGNHFGRSDWNCAGFATQTVGFVSKVENNEVEFGYGGQHTRDFNTGIRVGDVQWLLQYLGRVTDAQIRTGLSASGADSEDMECFTKELRKRINQLQDAAAGRMPRKLK